MRGILLIFLLLLAPAWGERELEVQSGDLTLGATLELPAGEGPFPAVLLVHGSGPNDRDETLDLGVVKIRPFQELSRHLAAEGVAVLRYDKRSWVLKNLGLSQAFAKLTPLDFIEDARAALDLLAAQPEVDPRRIYVVGHSQGGTLAPWIVEDKQVAGMILLAPGLLAMREQIEYQCAYQLELLRELKLEAKAAAVEAARTQYRQLYARLDSEELKPQQMLGGASVAFYRESDRLGAEVIAKTVASPLPVLLVNGTHDLKCPERLLRSKAEELQQKPDLTIHYEAGMVHELYDQQYSKFRQTLAPLIADWMAANRPADK